MDVTYSRIDMNRAGIPLCEIVTEPDLRSAREASTIVQHLRQLIQYTHISSAHMQHGQLRVDCNVNVVPVVDPHGTTTLDEGQQQQQHCRTPHPRVEVKNLNSIQQIEECIQYEAYRQVQIVEQHYEQQCYNNNNNNNKNNPPPIPAPIWPEETRTYNAITKRTELLRTKDQAQDYRFLPELDVPPCVINRTVLQGCTTISEFLQTYTPTLPDVIQRQLVQHLGISSELAAVMVTNHPTVVQYFRQALLYALNGLDDLPVHENRNSRCSGSSRGTTTDLVAPQNLSWNDIAERHPQTSTAQLQKAAGEVANLQCNVLFHLVKEEHRSKLLQQQQQPQDSVPYDDTVDAAADHSLGDITMDQCPITARQLGEIVQMILNDEISNTMAKQLIQILCHSTERSPTTKNEIPHHTSPREVAKQRNITLITDSDVLRQYCTTVLRNHPNEVQVYQKGGKYKVKMEKLFIGKVMGVTRGNAHPERLRDIVMECLASTITTTTTNAQISEQQQ